MRTPRVRPFVALSCLLCLLGFALAPGCFTDSSNPVAQRLQAKAETAKAGVEQLHRAGVDVGALVALMRQVEPHIHRGDVAGAEALLDQVLARLDVRSIRPEMSEMPAMPEGSEGQDSLYGLPRKVTVIGYDDHIMEPFVSRDGKYLFFNNSNNPKVDTNLHWAELVDEHTAQYKGLIEGANTKALDAVASMDRFGRFFMVSSRSYEKTHRMIHTGVFAGGRLKNVSVVAGDIARGRKPYLNMDAEISADGETLYFTDNEFGNGGFPKTSNLHVARRNASGFEILPDSEQIMQAVNTDALEYAPATSEDELTLFFTRAELENLKKSHAEAELEIYMATRPSKTQPFGKPQRIDSIRGFVEAPTVLANGSLYFHRIDGGTFSLYRVDPR